MLPTSLMYVGSVAVCPTISILHSIPLLTSSNGHCGGTHTIRLRRNWRHSHRNSANTDFLSRNPYHCLRRCSPYLSLNIPIHHCISHHSVNAKRRSKPSWQFC